MSGEPSDLALVVAIALMLGLAWQLDDEHTTVRLPCSMVATHHPDIPMEARKQCEKT